MIQGTTPTLLFNLPFSASIIKSAEITIKYIDDFKKVNDTYGHVKGDMVILELARIMREVCGDKYTAASYDLSAQICPFIEHLFDVFDGKSTLTFSYAIVGGADVTGTLLYFFVSPFSFLFLIFGDGKVAHASSIVMLCKMSSIAFAGTWFAKKLFNGIPDYLCIAIGVVYAYCGYTFVSNTYINWMDFLIYLPFTVAAFRRFVLERKQLGRSTQLCWQIKIVGTYLP